MTDAIELANIRTDYCLKSFSEKDVLQNPFLQLEAWLKDALTAEVNESNAMTLATIKSNGKPSARIVLLKSLSQDGLVFFTNYSSNKGNQLQENPHIALVFFWPELQRQVRVEGVVSKISDAESDAYFYSRPIESQIGAIASPQSKKIGSRQEIEDSFAKLKEVFANEPIIRPNFWGGFLVKPNLFEFWQGRESRLHDRFEFELQNNNSWIIRRLAP